MTNESITWRAPEFLYYEKGRVWSIGVALIAAVLILIALWQANFLLAMFVAVGGILVVYWGTKQPEMLEFTLSKKGLDIAGRKLYPMESFTGFAMREDATPDGSHELVLKTKSALSTFLKVIVPADQSEEVRAVFAASVEEMEYEETLTEYIAKLLRF